MQLGDYPIVLNITKNTPIQIYWKFHHQKNKKISDKKF